MVPFEQIAQFLYPDLNHQLFMGFNFFMFFFFVSRFQKMDDCH